MSIPFRTLDFDMSDSAIDLYIDGHLFVVRVRQNGVSVEATFDKEGEAFEFFVTQTEKTSLPEIATGTIH